MSVPHAKFRHFLDLHTIDSDQLHHILAIATQWKQDALSGKATEQPFSGKHLAMIFEKPSTRTRVSFEVGMHALGGQTVVMDSNSSQLGRGETIADTARVLSRYVDIIMIRCFDHDDAVELATHASVPVINGLTDESHPCQIMADILTFQEHRGPITHKTIAWVGDGNNVMNSWIHAAVQFDFTLQIATPKTFSPCKELLAWAKAHTKGQVEWTEDPVKAVQDADAVITDTWVSMGAENAEARLKALAPYQVNASLMQHAKKNALFLHCLPAHRGDEVTDDIMDGPHSVVWDEAENRMHVQKAIMLWCLGFC